MIRALTFADRLAIETNRRLVAAEKEERDAEAELASCTEQSEIPAAFRRAAVARDYAAECRARVAQVQGVAS